ncbi:MAG: hypothetical protein ABFS56_25440 [Pseudomonadota bacterium]
MGIMYFQGDFKNESKKVEANEIKACVIVRGLPLKVAFSMQPQNPVANNCSIMSPND